MAAVAVAVAVSGCSASSGDSADRATPPGDPTTRATADGSSSPSPDPIEEPTDDEPGTEPAGGDVPAVRALRAGRSTPVEDPYYPETSNPEVDVLHYGLGLKYGDEVLRGDATVTFRATKPTDRVRLDLSDALEVDSVTLDERDVDFAQRHDGLTMTTPGLRPAGSHTFVITYSGAPTSTQAPSQRADMTEGLGWNTEADGSVYTFQEPYGAFTWYPANDHPSDEALFDVDITTPAPDVGVFNGTMESKTSTGDTTTTSWHLDEPSSTYLTTIAIGPYREYSAQTKSGMTLTYWLMRRDRGLLPELRRESSQAFDWLVAHAGPYPFSSLGFVVVGGQSAMETQTMITLSRGVVEVPSANIEHEMAHQWFGDSVSPVDWQGMWLNEGWAMYMQQWYERDVKPFGYAGGISRWPAIDNDSRREAGPPGDYGPEHFAEVNVYLGPALMLEEIRQRIGDARSEQLVKAWAAEHENQNVDRAEFTTWVNHFTGQDLTSLIDLWLDSPTTPR